MISNKHFKLKNSLTYEYTFVAQISQATIDCSITLIRDGKEVKYSIPSGVSYRLRKAVNNITRFATPHPICVAWVGDRIVCAECPPAASLPDAKKQLWKSMIEINLSVFHPPADPYFDGQYIYTIKSNPEVFDRNYGALKLDYCWDLFHCNDPVWSTADRACFAYYANDEWVVTAPVTAATGSFLQLVSDDVSTKTAAVFNTISSIDEIRFVNLRFVNYAASSLANAFDFEVIEPLGLPLLMIEHGTFNLGELTTTIQMTCPAPLTFSQALAWLIGLHTRVTTLDQFITLKEVIKMLMSKGCTRKVSVFGEDDEDEEDGVSTSKNDVIHSARKHFSAMPMLEF